MKPFRVLLYYLFTEVADPAVYADQHRQKCQELGLLGRIIIADEGINGTASGTVEACDQYMEWLRSDPCFAPIEFKIDEAEAHAFKALYVRVRPEIITLGRPLSTPVQQRTGRHLSAVEWREMMDRDDVVIVDGRNSYESALGHFRGAVCPTVENFREMPGWIEEHREALSGKKILTYCTGGIRCEKLTSWMIEAGFTDLFQLHGGIVQYGKDPTVRGDGFEGVNVVFDERVTVVAGPQAKIVTECRECGTPSANYVNCSNVLCNIRMIQCERCEIATSRACSDACRDAPRKRLKGKKIFESSGGEAVERRL